MYTAYLKSYKKEFKHYISHHKEQARVSSITINPSELYCNSASVTWEDENKEIVHKGVLYDVINIGFNGLTVELTVVSDEQEMELKNQFAAMYDISSGKATKNPFNLLKVFFALKFVPAARCIPFNRVGEYRSVFYPGQSFMVVSKIIPKETPPPRPSV